MYGCQATSVVASNSGALEQVVVKAVQFAKKVMEETV